MPVWCLACFKVKQPHFDSCKNETFSCRLKYPTQFFNFLDSKTEAKSTNMF